MLLLWFAGSFLLRYDAVTWVRDVEVNTMAGGRVLLTSPEGGRD